MNAHGSPQESTTAAPLLAGRYQLLDHLGQGGMGAVFRARDRNLGRDVAVKILPAGKLTDSEAVARFRREALALARLSHPGIVQAHDSGQDGDQHFLVMELVEGRSLAAVLAEQGKVSPTRAADIGHQAARALGHAHRSGLVHRDVKPSNLLLLPDGTVKLLDLGLARFLQDQVGDASLTRAGAGMGTPDYCAPEQCRNAHTAGPRADVYSLGCTLYHLIAGRVPFPGSSLADKMEAHETRDPTPLEELCPEVPGGLALTVGRMMAKRPEDRFASMGEVSEALAPYVAASSPSFRELRSTTTWDGSQLTVAMRQTKRRRLRLALTATVALMLLVAGGAIWIGAGQGWFRGQEAEAVDNGPGSVDEPKAGPPAKAAVVDEPGVLTVSQKPAGGGKYRTIAEALEKIRPHQTIRIVDQAVYREAVLLNRKSDHEGITLEAPQGAVLEHPGKVINLITIRAVQGVTLRDLHLRTGNSDEATLVWVTGPCSGITLERVDFGGLGTDRRFSHFGVQIQDVPASGPRDHPAVLVRDCRFVKLRIGAQLIGVHASREKYLEYCPVHDIAVRNNDFLDCLGGVVVIGVVQKVQVVGNRFRGCAMSAWQFEHLVEPAGDFLIANNTAIDCGALLRAWDEKARGRGVRICNNLNLGASYPDAIAYDSGGHPTNQRGWGDGAAWTAQWLFSHNWREVKLPSKRPAERDGWIPPGKLDVCIDTIVINRESPSPDFLRPSPKSPLATAGAGKVDPSLPSYVGAVPPVGVKPWDWDRTWRARRAK
jgi:hypothetical protein